MPLRCGFKGCDGKLPSSILDQVRGYPEWMSVTNVIGLGPSGNFPQEYPDRIGEETRKFVDAILTSKTV